jgi:hypothetical protein
MTGIVVGSARRMKTLLTIVAILILMPLPALCASQAEKQIELINWMVFYYQKPEPEDFPNKLIAFSKAGLLSEERKQFPFLGFASTLFRDNPARLNTWLPKLETLPTDQKRIVFLSLWLSDTGVARELFRQDKYRELISGTNYFNFETDKPVPDLGSIDPMYGGFLDIQWGRFLASGNKEPIRLIISTLRFGDSWGAAEKYAIPLSEEQKQDIFKEAIFKAALWSLQSNCKVHPVVKNYCSELYESSELSTKEKKYLGMLLTRVYPEKYGKK